MAGLLTPAQLEQANGLLGKWLGDRTTALLGDACHAMDLAALAEGVDRALYGAITRRLVSTLLRKRGFAASGTAGTGYDRDTLYRKVAP